MSANKHKSIEAQPVISLVVPKSHKLIFTNVFISNWWGLLVLQQLLYFKRYFKNCVLEYLI